MSSPVSVGSSLDAAAWSSAVLSLDERQGYRNFPKPPRLLYLDNTEKPILHRNKARRERWNKVVAVEGEVPALRTPVSSGIVVECGTELFDGVGRADHWNRLVD